jgi:hypothetical protein
MSANRNSPESLQCLSIFLLFLSSKGNEGNKNIEPAVPVCGAVSYGVTGVTTLTARQVCSFIPLSPKREKWRISAGFSGGIAPFPNSPCRYLAGGRDRAQSTPAAVVGRGRLQMRLL